MSDQLRRNPHFYLSLTIIGLVAAMAWAIWGKTDPQEFAKRTRGWS
jgi:hypothetical protein